MKIYLVGGAVRDELLGLPVKEKDYVVVGATVADMQRLGYKQVGKEFPVFLHPKTGEEYALARKERKVAAGYQGFEFDTSPEVTLKEDLSRRDLTINAMAKDEDGKLFDPFHGQKDLNNKVLRHVSPAFGEDPVRILRIGRFLARYHHLGFHVADETLALMQQMTKAGEVNALVAERVWKELDRALAEPNPEQFFIILDKCGALPILFLAFNLAIQLPALTAAAALTKDTAIRFAALLYPLHEAITALCHRYRAPNAYRELAQLVSTHYATALRAETLSAEEWVSLFYAIDAFRRETRARQFLMTCQAIANAQNIIFNEENYLAYLNAARSVNVQALIAQGFTNNKLAAKLKWERQEKIAEKLAQDKT
jgi:tRNA nucleotidyltransferase (CCA-adding enzyme)